MHYFNVMFGRGAIREHIDRGSGTVQYILEGAEIVVHNLSYNKAVGFHINVDGVWKDFMTAYGYSLETGDGNIVEGWKGKEFGDLLKKVSITTPLPAKPTFQLAVFYHDLDRDTWYWDNNLGQDYFVPTT